MVVSGWFGGASKAKPAGYGVRITRRDRCEFFAPGTTAVTVDLDDGASTKVTLGPSFWRRCHELRSRDIGEWLLSNGLAPWPKGSPPKLELEPISAEHFRLRRLK